MSTPQSAIEHNHRFFNNHHSITHSPHNQLYAYLFPPSSPSNASTNAESADPPAKMPNPSHQPKPPPPSLIVEPSIPAACASLLSLRSGGRKYHNSSSDGNLPMLTTALTLLEDASRKQRASTSTTSTSSHKPKSSGSRFWDTVLPVKESSSAAPQPSAEDESAKMNIPCVVCGVRFRKPGHLNMHWRSVHATSADAVYPGKLQPRAVPPVPSQNTTTSNGGGGGGSSSTTRISKVKGVRPYGCPQCPSRFRRGSDRNRHMRMVHAKIRPFECTQCGNHFGRKSFLEAHISTVHEKQRPFRCECGAAFGQRSSLTRHQRKIHGAS